MGRENLLATLHELHSQLSDADALDAETLQMLSTVTGDIQRLVEHQDAPAAEDVDSAQNQLQAWLLKFESRHPRLASIVHEVADGLANLGI